MDMTDGTKFFLVKAGCSERYSERKGNPIIYDTEEWAEYYAKQVEGYTNMEWDVMSLKEYFDTYHPQVVSKDGEGDEE